MKTTKPKKQIRTTIPRSVFARLAFLAAREGVSVSQLVYVAILGHIANDGTVPLDDIPAMLAAEGVFETPPQITMPGDNNSGDANQASGPDIPDLL